VQRRPTFHFVDERSVEVEGHWLRDDADLGSLAGELLQGIRGDMDWSVAEGSIWHTICERWHRGFISLLTERDVSGLAQALAGMHQLPLLKGIDQSRDESARYREDEAQRSHFLLEVKSLLVRLAEALGLLGLEVDPRYGPLRNIYLPVGEIVGRLEEHLGIEIAPPAVGNGRFGLRVGHNAVLTNRDLYALYLASRCRQLAARWRRPPEAVRILEIGGGMGRLALYLRRMGFRHVTLIDLPQISLVQAYFLRRSVGGSVTFGRGAVAGGDGVQVVTQMAALAAAPDRRFDIVVNADSMPEMGWSVATEYVRSIRRTCRGVFLSANQESRKQISHEGSTHAVVAEIVREVGGFERAYRFPFWLRRGYVEELYEVIDGLPSEPRGR